MQKSPTFICKRALFLYVYYTMWQQSTMSMHSKFFDTLLKKNPIYILILWGDINGYQPWIFFLKKINRENTPILIRLVHCPPCIPKSLLKQTLFIYIHYGMATKLCLYIYTIKLCLYIYTMGWRQWKASLKYQVFLQQGGHNEYPP